MCSHGWRKFFGPNKLVAIQLDAATVPMAGTAAEKERSLPGLESPALSAHNAFHGMESG